MRILMFTNIYLPHVGGVARSVGAFAEALRDRGHTVKVVAPFFDNMPMQGTNVIRVPAHKNFNRSGFSMLFHRGVRTPIHIIPTGLSQTSYLWVNGAGFRERNGIPADAFVVGHVGRLAREKNLKFLSLALGHYCRKNPKAHALVVGIGPMKDSFVQAFDQDELADRLHMFGVLNREELSAAYKAMNVFAFSSQSETQGMVLAEAMAAGLPVVALDGPGVNDLIIDGINGRIVTKADIDIFVDAIVWLECLKKDEREKMSSSIARTVEAFSMATSRDKLLNVYESLSVGRKKMKAPGKTALRLLKQQRRIAVNYLLSGIHAVMAPSREMYTFPGDIPTGTKALQPDPSVGPVN